MHNGGGFTLAELLIVVAVIAVLVAVAIPTFSNQLEKSRQAVDVSNLRGAYAAARLAEIDQAVGNETFATVVKMFKDKVNSTGYVSGLQYWYNPDTGTLTRVQDPDKASGQYKTYGVHVKSSGLIVGKATATKVVADISQLPGDGYTILYNNGSLAAETGTNSTEKAKATAGTVDKGILVTYRSDVSREGMYVIDKIGFVTSSGQFAPVANSGTLKSYYHAVNLPGTLSSSGTTTAQPANGTGIFTIKLKALTATDAIQQQRGTTKSGNTANTYKLGNYAGTTDAYKFTIDNENAGTAISGSFDGIKKTTTAEVYTFDIKDNEGYAFTHYMIVTKPGT